MTIFKRVPVLLAILLTVTGLAASQALTEQIPIDTQITIGKLPNGLQYYVRANNRPEKRAELRLAVKAGSVLEDDDQQGLAHFLEHMAFNGTQHFPKNEIVSFIESLGMRFGADLNAYTGFDETVYMAPIVPHQGRGERHDKTVTRPPSRSWCGRVSRISGRVRGDPAMSREGGVTVTGDEALVGRVLNDRYLIGNRIARGGMACVFRAVDRRLDREVAIKVMHHGLGDDQQFTDRFVREAKSAAQLNHRNVVSVFDQGRDGDVTYLVMDPTTPHPATRRLRHDATPGPGRDPRRQVPRNDRPSAREIDPIAKRE